ncbi:hypothetical protein [Modestobacter altitudinis]|uniref:hypothetical protein n=1 Tax=Modestobacter altitudinis TaxID=2213158 RepID=UPI00110D1AEA|nr:hypothetical protein [Modestobacter altitudinis]
MPSLTSLVGAATAGYGAALVAVPTILLRPCGLAETPDTRLLTRSLGVRDVVLGLALVAAPAGRARRLATGARVVADAGDAAAFGAGLAGRGARAPLVALAAASWGAVTLLADVLDERAGR